MPHLLAQVAADRPVLGTTNFRTLAPGNGGVIWFCCCWHLCFKLSFVVVVFVVVFAISYPDKVSERGWQNESQPALAGPAEFGFPAAGGRDAEVALGGVGSRAAAQGAAAAPAGLLGDGVPGVTGSMGLQGDRVPGVMGSMRLWGNRVPGLMGSQG